MSALFGEGEVPNRGALAVVADFEHIEVAVLVEVSGEVGGLLEVDDRRDVSLERLDAVVDAPGLRDARGPVHWVLPAPLAEGVGEGGFLILGRDILDCVGHAEEAAVFVLHGDIVVGDVAIVVLDLVMMSASEGGCSVSDANPFDSIPKTAIFGGLAFHARSPCSSFVCSSRWSFILVHTPGYPAHVW